MFFYDEILKSYYKFTLNKITVKFTRTKYYKIKDKKLNYDNKIIVKILN